MPDRVLPLELDLDDLGAPAPAPGDRDPISEVRQVDARIRRLVVDTGIRGAAAEQAWVTVTDEAGAVRFEGAPSADGCVEVSFEDAPGVQRVRVLLETARSHRQAEITLRDGWNAHAFN
jgi:hypothetical protein